MTYREYVQQENARIWKDAEYTWEARRRVARDLARPPYIVGHEIGWDARCRKCQHTLINIHNDRIRCVGY
jgi:hypothetical protein